MRKRTILSTFVVAAWRVAGCSGGGTKATPTPTDTASPTATATETAVPTATPVPEVINGVAVTPVTVGAPVDIPENAVLYVAGGCNYCDLPVVSLERVYRDPAGTCRFGNLVGPAIAFRLRDQLPLPRRMGLG